MINQCSKYEVSRFTRCEAMNSGAKCTNWGSWGALMGHSRSSAMSPFDRAHTTSYLTLIETMRLSCTVFEIQPAICQKSPILTHPTCIWRPRRGDPGGISRRSLASENQSPWGIVWCCLRDTTFSRFSRTPTCDRHKHRQTDRHTPMASTADAQHRAVKTYHLANNTTRQHRNFSLCCQRAWLKLQQQYPQWQCPIYMSVWFKFPKRLGPQRMSDDMN